MDAFVSVLKYFVYLCATKINNHWKYFIIMVEINDKLVSRFTSQQDGIHLEDEERKLLSFAETYAMCDHAIVALNNMRTGKCYIFLGKTAEVLGIGKAGTHVCVDSVFEESKQGICYALCVYKFTNESFTHARLIHKLTGEERRIDISELRSILSNREKELLQYIQRGQSMSRDQADYGRG